MIAVGLGQSLNGFLCRRVRETPGGKDTLNNFWGTEGEEPEFKPTRRVREGPGGRDSISGVSSVFTCVHSKQTERSADLLKPPMDSD